MSTTSLLAIVIVSLEILPIACRRLITDPYPEREWDSVVVSSDPITIREKTTNATTSLAPNEILRPQKRSYERCPENDFACLYGNDEEKSKDGNQIVDKFLEKYSHVADVKYDDRPAEEKGSENSRKTYWMAVDTLTRDHPYDDREGWVTLDPVPWSTSKISKWHPEGVHQENKPWGYGSAAQRPVQQFWVSGSGYRPQMPGPQWGIGANDIITDNKPSDFPSGHHYGNRVSSHLPGNRDRFHQNNERKGHPSRHPQNGHPSTYPSNSNGEWVLLSSTKGYSHPQRHRWPGQRNIKANPLRGKTKPIEISKYHEEELNEKSVASENSEANRKSDANVAADPKNGTTEGEAEGAPVQILYTGSPKEEDSVATFRRKVRLQVLPSLENASTSYGGLLEVDAHSQTVDEAQQEDEKMKKLKAIANVKKNKIRGYKLVPASRVTGKGMSENMMTLAAVGAGMIPATMALLVPMALGRKKRNIAFGPGMPVGRETEDSNGW